jgi:membrane protein
VLLVLAGTAWLLERTGAGGIDPAGLVEAFFPPHETPAGGDPFEAVEVFLAQLMAAARRLSPYAVPAFLWFSTRLFAGIRTALNEIYDVSLLPTRRHFALAYLLGKVRDFGMVAVTLTLFLASAALSAGLVLLQERGRDAAPGLAFFLTTAGRFAGQALAFLFLLVLFFALYHFASLRRPPWRATLVASLVSASLFEVAKRLFGLYLRNVVSFEQVTVDVNVGAGVLFVVWMYYSALVFLLGGVVAETWELRELQRKQRTFI